MDKRKYPRLDAKVLVLSVLGEKNPEVHELMAKDISYEGVSFYTDYPVNNGEVVEIKISLPIDPEPICAKAKVVWTSIVAGESDINYVAGVKFIEINKNRLKEIIGQL